MLSRNWSVLPLQFSEYDKALNFKVFKLSSGFRRQVKLCFCSLKLQLKKKSKNSLKNSKIFHSFEFCFHVEHAFFRGSFLVLLQPSGILIYCRLLDKLAIRMWWEMQHNEQGLCWSKLNFTFEMHWIALYQSYKLFKKI